jgi:site-specific DNA-adenine methylase
LEFFNSQASNYLVSVAVKINKIEKKIAKNTDSESLLELYNGIRDGVELIESKIKKIEEEKLKGVSDER